MDITIGLEPKNFQYVGKTFMFLSLR